ncbi:probable phospholipid-transporting ATPase IM [Oncorhynchus keta]|uniref:probable phospholipid-transporting ATPase IM n=1 Tax=Oncorhynchus keta TaxID=8018 RepID=UPI00227C532C|nr:probable phospholipid-transporting ATPase IM [Oncorhynchus keta]
MSLFDQDVNDMWSFQHPSLYVPGQLNQYFSKTAFFKCALHSVYSSVVLFFIPYAAMYDTVRDDGRDIADYQSFALLAQTCLVITVCIQLCLDMSYWTAVNQFFVWGVWPCTLLSPSACTVMARISPSLHPSPSSPIELKEKYMSKQCGLHSC